MFSTSLRPLIHFGTNQMARSVLNSGFKRYISENARSSLPEKLPVYMKDGSVKLLPVVWDKVEELPGGNRKRGRIPRVFSALGIIGISYILYDVYKVNQIRQAKRKVYDDLKLGAFTDQKLKALHLKKDEDLSTEEIYEQLTTYASFGIKTQLNSALIKEKSSEESTDLNKYKRLVETIDCGDAGLPYGNVDEVVRCYKLAKKLHEEVLRLQQLPRPNSLSQKDNV